MNTSISILICGLIASAASVTASTKPSDAKGDIERRIHATKDLRVPLPAKTPFDSDPKARKVYLDSFQRGYWLAVAGILTTGCTVKWTYMQAEVAGHYNGQSQAVKDYPGKFLGTETQPAK